MDEFEAKFEIRLRELEIKQVVNEINTKNLQNGVFEDTQEIKSKIEHTQKDLNYIKNIINTATVLFLIFLLLLGYKAALLLMG